MSLGDVKAALAALPEDERAELIKLLEQLDRATKGKVERDNFAAFRSLMYPDYVDGAHLRIMADAFQRVAEGKLKRLIVTLPPRHMKSVQCSVLFPAWFIGRYPKKKIMQVSNTAELAQGFGRQVKNMIQSREYRDVFPDVKLAADSTAAGRWNTNKGGEYYAVGMGGALAGRGADCAYFRCKVETQHGMKEISDVRVGDKVRGYNHATGKAVWTTVRAVSTQRKPNNFVKFGDAILTPEHRVWTSKNGYVEVSSLLQDFSSLSERSREKQETPQSERSNLLQQSVLSGLQTVQGLRMWRDQSSECEILQGVLSEGQARVSDVRVLPIKIFDAISGGSALAQSRASSQVLQSEVLRQSQIGKSSYNFAARLLRHLLSAINREKIEVLQPKMLLGKESKNDRIFWLLECSKTKNKKKIFWGLRSLRKGKAENRGSPHRSQLVKSLGFESGDFVRQLPSPLSSSDIGVCANDLARLLPKPSSEDDQLVVDIQTDTHNFFLEGVLVHNCLIIDDPHSESEALAAESGDQSIYDKAFHWYMLARQRLQPGGAIIICVTRWSQRDLVAQILKAEKERGEAEWEVIDFPAILPSGKQLWPEFWSLKELNAVKNELPIHRWSAQYQQNPVSVGAALIKSNWWRKWDIDERGKLPEMEYIIQSWDTATTANTRSNFSACTTWGMFYARGPGGRDYPQFILLDAFRARLEFPDLKQKAKELNSKFKPDALLIENTAQGTSLIPELRLAGLPVTPFNPGRVKNDKILRVNGVSDIFKSGQIWYVPSKQAEEVIAQFEAFPNSGDGDDYVDSCTQAIATARAGGVIRLERDEDWTEDSQSKPGNRYYSVF